jgi:inner membrane protein
LLIWKSIFRSQGILKGKQIATVISHSIAALAIGKAFAPEGMPPKFWILTAVCAALPDIDVVGFAFGIQYRDMLGHRGLTHSLTFALALSLLVVLLFFRDADPFGTSWWVLVLYFFVVTASHGVLDALTNGGLGVAFFAPFSNRRYFLPSRPIEVSPIGIEPFLTARGMAVIISEIKWIWMPSLILLGIARFHKRMF